MWLHALSEMGVPDTSVWANVMSHAVFKNPKNGQKTYLAYNPTGQAIEVRFSDGVHLSVAPQQLLRYKAP
jgi:hypothetical protein